MRWAAVRDAARRAGDGALTFDEWPSGTVYLVDGCVAHAETSDVPDLGERLVAAGRLSAGQWSAVLADVADGARMADLLGGYGVGRHELAALTESVVVDSISVLLVDPDGAGPGRFTPGTRPTADADLRLDEAALRDVLAQRPADPVRAGIRPASVVEPAPPAWRWRVVTADEWRVLCGIGERARIRDLARARGVGVHEVVDQVADLVRAGLCVVRPAPDARAVDAPTEGTAPAPGVGSAEGTAPGAEGGRAPGGWVDEGDLLSALPRRVPGEALPPPADVLSTSSAMRPLGLDVPAPDVPTLRRLLDSLQRMD